MIDNNNNNNNISLSNGNLTKISNGSSEFSELNKEINHIIQEGGNLSEFSIISNNNNLSTNSSNFVNKNISNNNIINININEHGIWNKKLKNLIIIIIIIIIMIIIIIKRKKLKF